MVWIVPEWAWFSAFFEMMFVSRVNRRAAVSAQGTGRLAVVLDGHGVVDVRIKALFYRRRVGR